MAAPNFARGRGRGGRIGSLYDKPESTADSAATSHEEPPQASGVYSTNPLQESKQGSTGKEISLCANYFKLVKKTNFEFSMYHVDFVPELEMATLRKAFIGQQRETFGGYLFDGQSAIYLTRRLEKNEMTFECESREGQKYKMKVKNTGLKIQITDAMAIQILNLILRRTMDGLSMQLVGRNMYDPNNKVLLKQFKVELWPGYITSIRQHEHDVLVCCEVSHKVMRQETIYDIMRTARNEDASNWQDKFKKEVIGAIVLTDYNNKTYRVDDVDFNSSPRSTFKHQDVDVSYKDYYNTRYNITVRDLAQPMLVSNPKPRDVRAGRGDQVIFLVPEFCRATGLTDKMRSNFTMMRGMAEYTQMDPEKRKKRLLEFSARLLESKESSNHLKSFNTEFSSELVPFKGRALPQETMQFGNDKTAQNNDGVDWTNAMKCNQMYQSVPLKRWVFIYPKKFVKESEEFLAAMQTVSGGMKYDMCVPKKIEVPDDRTGSFVSAVEGVIGKDPKMIMIVVPTNAADRYAAIKRLTCVNNAIPTQVIVAKTLTPKKGGVMSIATKVIIQVNCKLGGAPWMIKFPIKGLMSIGFDVNHDSHDRSKSYGAFIASMDIKSEVKFYSGVTAHKDGTEMSNNITVHMHAALREFKEVHGALPERIIMYRDGVGDGQIEYVHSQEVRKLEEKLNFVYEQFGNGSTPKFTVIVVNKRLNTRIFLNQGSKVANPVSGTIVDNTITLPERYDFFLVSQSVRQGTVAPTSYNVIHDTSKLSPDQMQLLTYKQTHLYYNWSGCVRVPAVVQYAHKLALLVGEFLHQSPSEGFNRQLYFL